jgi:hypothetical protein
MRLFRAIAFLFVAVLFFQCQKEVSYVGQPDPYADRGHDS